MLTDVARFAEQGVDTVLFCDNRAQAGRLTELFDETAPDGLAARPALEVGSLHAGFVWEDAGVALWTDHELFQRTRRAGRRTRFRGTGRVADAQALKPGDHCVHVDHGVARFLGLRVIEVDDAEAECLLLEYAGGDRLYLPTDKLNLVERYDVPDDQEVQLHKLGGATWERQKKRARKAIMAVAQELLSFYASRQTLPGHAYSPDTHLVREMENSFVHEETRDQLAAAEAMKRDMETPRPMDRLICGDVGFGKTEVAMRGAFKAVQEGKQVAVLCPTTILAEQHRETFAQRLREFPVTVEVLSRFRTPKQQKEVLKRAKEGKVDVLVGTHRLLGRDVQFRDLGMIVVDEEQRFGVRHKEKLKQLRKEVDVLTLSATPIPRTLHLALMGARDLSIIATPPRERLPIHTEVVPFSEEMVAEALRREMHRGGQVFFVHNRVETIDAVRAMVEKIVPEARVLAAHGQMHETGLESIMKEFVEGEADVLVTTMIIESGLDMPNVNTILIDRADRFGLSQLHQLRGRVGRSRHQAYAYLMVPSGQQLTREARARLSAIQEFTDLGSGYHLAMRDLEIRGAGNILGENQSGHMATIGFDLYCKMLEEEIRSLKGEGLPRLQDVKVDLRVSAYLPDETMADPEVKIRWYRETRPGDRRARARPDRRGAARPVRSCSRTAAGPARHHPPQAPLSRGRRRGGEGPPEGGSLHFRWRPGPEIQYSQELAWWNRPAPVDVQCRPGTADDRRGRARSVAARGPGRQRASGRCTARGRHRRRPVAFLSRTIRPEPVFPSSSSFERIQEGTPCRPTSLPLAVWSPWPPPSSLPARSGVRPRRRARSRSPASGTARSCSTTSSAR